MVNMMRTFTKSTKNVASGITKVRVLTTTTMKKKLHPFITNHKLIGPFPKKELGRKNILTVEEEFGNIAASEGDNYPKI